MERFRRFKLFAFFHFKGEDPYLRVKRVAQKCADTYHVNFEGVDDRLDGALQELKPGEWEVMVGWSTYAPNPHEAENLARKLYESLKRELGEAFIELENPKHRITVESD